LQDNDGGAGASEARVMTDARIKIQEIKIGKRQRVDMGDVGELAESIEQLGLLHPIVVTSKKELIAGERRLLAFKKLGREEIPATIIDIDALVLGEQAENINRKDFTVEERVTIGEAIEELLDGLGERRGKKPSNIKGLNSEIFRTFTGGRSTKIAAQKAGFKNERTYEQARIVVAAGGQPLADMNKSGHVAGPYKRVRVAKQAAEIRREPPPLPDQGPYRVIVADPPWPYELRAEDPSHRGTTPYPQMSVEQICAVDVQSIAHDDCILWLWCTNAHLVAGFATQAVETWGFRPVTLLTWAKARMGTGDWLRGQTEHCVMGVRGKPTVVLTNQTTLLHGPAREHSRKPDEFYTFVETLCPAPRYAYLFSREQRDKWDMHGDEA
jgi:N6-adenosine-specific RNA methylase IME4